MDERECREQLANCNKRFERGAEAFARIEAEIRHLQEKDNVQNGTWKDSRIEVLERVRTLEKEVDEIKTSANRILAGIVVACILMVINIITGF